MENEPTEGQHPAASVVRLMFGHMAAQTLTAAARLRLADAFGDATSTPAELAASLGTEAGALRRLLRALTGLGLLVERAPDEFALTATGAALRTDRDDSMHEFVLMFGHPTMLSAWQRLDDSVRNGQTAFDKVFGTDFFSYLKDDRELSELFNVSMRQGSKTTAAVLPASYDFARFESIVDVGGGDGTLLAAVLGEHHGPRGIVFDTAEGGAQAAATFAAAGLTERTEVWAGDFFADVPAGGELYLVKSVIHDWDDERCATILKHIRAVLPAHGRLLVIEPVLPPTVATELAGIYLSDLNMLVNVGGRERTKADFETLFESAGFAKPTFNQLPAPSGFWLIESTPD